MNENYLHSEVTASILKAFFKVYNTLGYGFLEKVYENAMVIELRRMGLKCEAQFSIKVYYEEHIVGRYSADLFVSDVVAVELKAAPTLHPDNDAQLLNYLKATSVEVGMLLNFGPVPDYRRKVMTNKYKMYRHCNGHEPS
jgi:GxxExxY protein